MLSVFLATSGASAASFAGIPEISDADTVIIGGRRLRIAGADAPETDQVCLDAKGAKYPCGVAARLALARSFAGKTWRCEQTSSHLSYGRPVVRCEAGRMDVARWLVEKGWALGDPRFKRPYDAEEKRARKAKAGLWSGSFYAPWDWRHHTCKTTILGAYSVPLAAQKSLCPEVPESERPKDPKCAVKANFTSRAGTCVFHLPTDHSYFSLRMTKPGRRWFCDAADAIGAGCRRAMR